MNWLVLVAMVFIIFSVFGGKSGLSGRVALLERELAEAKKLLEMLVKSQQPAVADAPRAETAQPPVIAENTPATTTEAGPEKRINLVKPMADMPRVDLHRAPIASKPDFVTRFIVWITKNWVYAVSAASLALAGVFFVQYGIENGLLPPYLRVLSGIGFGLAMIGAGEWLRRRMGDSAAATTEYLPSVFAGAGLVSVFAAVLSARLIYGLIGPEAAFLGHLATAALAIGLGWFYGPLLVSVGLIGAFAAPFIVAGGSAPGPWLYGYFAVIALVGLCVDTLRRWAWVSVLALVLGYIGGWLMMAGGAGNGPWILTLLVLAVLAIVVPERGLIPQQQGPSVVQWLWRREALVPFPAQLATGAAVATGLGLLQMAGSPTNETILALGALTALALAYLLWADRAEGLVDLAYVPAVCLWISLILQGLMRLPILDAFWLTMQRGPEVGAPFTVTLLLGMAALISFAFALRSFRGGKPALIDGVAATLVAPVAAVILELFWQPAAVIGVYPWALQVMVLAAGMVALALRYSRDADHRRMAYAGLSALSLIALSLFLLTTKTGLTLALAVLALVAAGLDRRFRLPEMGWFIQLSVAVLGYRLLVDPGLEWAFDAAIGWVVLAFGGAIAASVAACKILPLDRNLSKGVLESAAIGWAAILANILISRLILKSDLQSDVDFFTHWGLALNALPWLVLALIQIYRIRLGGVLQRLRQGIALIAGLFAAIWLVMAVLLNPMMFYAATTPGALVKGPLIVDSLLLAYAVPGGILLLSAWKILRAGKLRLGFIFAGFGLLALYIALEIRRFWHGDWLGAPIVLQGELYAYTVAMMLFGAGLFYQAMARRSGRLRRVAMAVIGMTIAKVFLLDASGLSGLTRVFSFLGLGLSLAGLAWLNRWAGEMGAKDEPPKSLDIEG